MMKPAKLKGVLEDFFRVLGKNSNKFLRWESKGSLCYTFNIFFVLRITLKMTGNDDFINIFKRMTPFSIQNIKQYTKMKGDTRNSNK